MMYLEGEKDISVIEIGKSNLFGLCCSLHIPALLKFRVGINSVRYRQVSISFCN